MLESIGALINKLKQQYESSEPVPEMLVTIEAIRNLMMPSNRNGAKAFNGVSVILPVMTQTSAEPLQQREQMMPAIAAVLPEPAPKHEEKLVFELDPESSEPTEVVSGPSANAAPLEGTHFDIPTFAQWPEQPDPVIPVVKEVNQTIREGRPLLHEKLETVPLRELGSTLQKEPIKDLKKAININERYQFINQLFKGDETMYERSIKTINGFNVYSEAEFWIRRELAVKLTWKEDDAIVQQFNQLVSRRFL